MKKNEKYEHNQNVMVIDASHYLDLMLNGDWKSFLLLIYDHYFY